MNKRIIVIFIIILIILVTTSILAALFIKSRSGNGPVAETASPVIETAKTSATTDTDDDGLTDEQERKYDTDTLKQDTDGDGLTDGEEVAKGYDPLKPTPGDRIVKEESANPVEQSKEEDKRKKVLNDMATTLAAGDATGAANYTVSTERDIMERKFSEALRVSPDRLKVLASALRQAKLLSEDENNAQYVATMIAPTGQKIESPFSMIKEAQDWKVAGL